MKTVVIVNRLPKTRSGKILRGIIKKICQGQEYTAPSTIEDMTVLDEITYEILNHGLGEKVHLHFDKEVEQE